jgi:hypothetical protein
MISLLYMVVVTSTSDVSIRTSMKVDQLEYIWTILILANRTPYLTQLTTCKPIRQVATHQRSLATKLQWHAAKDFQTARARNRCVTTLSIILFMICYHATNMSRRGMLPDQSLFLQL